ncbi:MAG: hypothetical protein JNK58_02170 [Phycisphaerae bacterium]|nr:hypothetical protein [Phycisphaerae bacterium]
MACVRSIVAGLVLAVSCLSAQAANLVVNGGFETGNFSGWSTAPAPSGSLFSVAFVPHSGTYGVSFGATGGQFDSIWQYIPTAAGSRYTLSFWIFNSGIGNDGFTVEWGTEFLVYQAPVTYPGAWTRVTFAVTGTAPSTFLRFRAFDGPASILLDDVSVEPDNLIVNPSFESGDFSGWNTMPAPTGTLFSVTTEAHTGTYGAYFGALNGQDDQIWQTVPTQPGSVYVLQFWAYNAGYSGDRLRVLWNGQPVYTAQPAPASGGGWAHFTLVLVAAGATSELRFGAFDAPAHIQIDDVYLASPANPQCQQYGDADRNNTVNFADITAVLTSWNATCTP